MAKGDDRMRKWTPKEMASTGLSTAGMRRLKVVDFLSNDSGRQNLECPFKLYYFFGDHFDLSNRRRKNILFIPGGPGVVEKRGSKGKGNGNDRDLQFLEPSHNVVYFHVRGTGLSKIRPSNKYDRFLRADYVAEDIERLRKRILKDDNPWDAIVGHSHGTVIAQRYAYKYGSERVRRLVLAAPAVRSLRDTRRDRIQVTATNLEAIYRYYRSRRNKKQFEAAATTRNVQLLLLEDPSKIDQSTINFSNDFCFLDRQRVERICQKLDRLITELERRYYSLNFVIENYHDLVEQDRAFLPFAYPEIFFQAIRELQFNGVPRPNVQFKPETKNRQIHAATLLGYYLAQRFKPPRKRDHGEPKFEERASFLRNLGPLARGFYLKRLKIAEQDIQQRKERGLKSRRAYYVFGVHDGISRWILKTVDRQVHREGFFRGSDIQQFAFSKSNQKRVSRQLAQRIGTVPTEPLYPWHPGNRRHEVQTLILNGDADAVTAGLQAEDFFQGGIINKAQSVMLKFKGVGHLALSLPVVSKQHDGRNEADPMGILVREFLRQRTAAGFLKDKKVHTIIASLGVSVTHNSVTRNVRK